MKFQGLKMCKLTIFYSYTCLFGSNRTNEWQVMTTRNMLKIIYKYGAGEYSC